ncbi:endonuclease NucS domain-containing protein [Nostoc sp.]|uniref:endonuclease NucS domain-containing protein n=1 Tax=Nostoc sp. TaxID=1180 RepID=UPI002FF70570
MTKEAKIRDFLVNNLHLIEDGLNAIKTEFKLPNISGSDGSVDIIARDKFGLIVIIEIKTSNSSAKNASHQLCKYVALIKQNLKIADKDLRCILISTDWHELIVPFSDFKRNVKYPVDGYSLSLDPEFIPYEAKKVKPTPEIEENNICPKHLIFSFEKQSIRDDALSKLDAIILEEIGIKNYYILAMCYEGKNKKVYDTYPFIQYLVIDELRIHEKEAIIGKTYSLNTKDENIFQDSWIPKNYLAEQEKWEFEELVICEISRKLSHLCEKTGTSNPEEFARLQKSWKIEEICRQGRLASSTSKTLINDEDLLKEIMGLKGGNAERFFSIINPNFQLSWNSAIQKIHYCLLGNEVWQAGLESFLDKIKNEHHEANVSVFIYNPCNILLSLYNVHFHPILEVLVDNLPDNKVIFLTGFIEWDRKTYPENLENIIKSASEIASISYPLFAIQGKNQELFEMLVMSKHGLDYSLIETTLHNEQIPTHKYVYVEENGIETENTDAEEFKTFNYFIQVNDGYLHYLRQYIKYIWNR